MFFSCFSLLYGGVNQNSVFIGFFAVQHHAHLKNEFKTCDTDSVSKMHQFGCIARHGWGVGWIVAAVLIIRITLEL